MIQFYLIGSNLNRFYESLIDLIGIMSSIMLWLD